MAASMKVGVCQSARSFYVWYRLWCFFNTFPAYSTLTGIFYHQTSLLLHTSSSEAQQKDPEVQKVPHFPWCQILAYPVNQRQAEFLVVPHYDVWCMFCRLSPS